METCSMCFKTKDLKKAHPDASKSAMVCAGCGYDIQRVAGYLSFHGAVIVSATEDETMKEARRAASEEAPAPKTKAAGKKVGGTRIEPGDKAS